MAKLPLSFLGVLSLTLTLVFGIHLFLLNANNLPLWDNLITLSYILNFLLAAAIFLFIFYMRKKLSNAIGFVFMGGSLLKFLIFFLFFYPVYMADGNTNKLEIAAFLIPYLVALILETYYASKMLNSIET